MPKVEIIERYGYKFTLTCRKCGRSMMLEAGPLRRTDTTIDECALCDEKSAEYARGLRKALELAERLGVSEGYPGRPLALVSITKLKEAVEKELEPR